jgi:hypothetical protein
MERGVCVDAHRGVAGADGLGKSCRPIGDFHGDMAWYCFLPAAQVPAVGLMALLSGIAIEHATCVASRSMNTQNER